MLRSLSTHSECQSGGPTPALPTSFQHLPGSCNPSVSLLRTRVSIERAGSPKLLLFASCLTSLPLPEMKPRPCAISQRFEGKLKSGFNISKFFSFSRKKKFLSSAIINPLITLITVIKLLPL